MLEVSPAGGEGWTLPDALWDPSADSISDPVSGPSLCLAVDCDRQYCALFSPGWFCHVLCPSVCSYLGIVPWFSRLFVLLRVPGLYFFLLYKEYKNKHIFIHYRQT